MFGMNGNGFSSDMAMMFLREYWLFFAFAALFSAPVAPRISHMLRSGGMGMFGGVVNVVRPLALTAVFVACVAYLIRGSYNPFIYFNF
jgi:alginate O-acetyltransferase complex protein AlgI